MYGCLIANERRLAISRPLLFQIQQNRFNRSGLVAESTGLEPVHPYRDDGLAIRCITTLPTLHRGTEL